MTRTRRTPAYHGVYWRLVAPAVKSGERDYGFPRVHRRDEAWWSVRRDVRLIRD
jgi:hypothetical protein